MKKILITGGAGFIGSEIVNQLSATKKWLITVLDALTEQIHSNSPEESFLYDRIKDKCSFIKGDIRDFDTVKKAVADNEYIIHLAAETGTGQSMYQINRYNEVNIMGTSNILQAISNLGKDSNVKKIVLASSRSVYGEGRYNCTTCGIIYPDSRNRENMISGHFALYCPNCGKKLELLTTTEDSLLKPASLYAFTKFAQENMLKTMCPALNIGYTIFRFQNVYGAGQSLKNPYTGILSIFSTLLLENKPINIFEDGLESRDFIHVKDIADGVIASLDNSISNGETINLGSGVNTTVIEIAETLKKTYNSRSKLNITGDFRIGDIAHNKADITKARTLLAFEPKITLEEGLEDFCNWVKKQGKGYIDYESSLTELATNGLLITK